MKHGKWVPIDSGMAKYLPKDRPYSFIEAMYCLQLNYNKGTAVTVAGLSKSWGWSRNKVSRFLVKVSVEVIYPAGTENKRNKRGKLVFQEWTYNEQIEDIISANNGHNRLINNKWLEYELDISRAKNGNRPGIPFSTINETNTETDTDKENIREEEDEPEHNPVNSGSGNICPKCKCRELDQEQAEQCDVCRGGKEAVVDLPGTDAHGNDIVCQPGPDSLVNGKALEVTDGTAMDNPGPGSGNNPHGPDSGTGGDNGNPVKSGTGQHSGIHQGDAGRTLEGVKDESLEAPIKDQDEQPPKKKKPKKKKNGIVLDFSKVDPLIEKAVLDEFIEFRKERKKPVKTQRTLTGICNAAMRTSKELRCDPNHALLYACREAGSDGWLSPKIDYFAGNERDFFSFVASLKTNITQKNNMIECKNCKGFDKCDNRDTEKSIPACNLYEPKAELAPMNSHAAPIFNQMPRATTVAQASLLEKDQMAKALLRKQEKDGW
jgi:hypothetical protein